MSKNKMLSICITIRNRSKFPVGNGEHLYLFPHCVESIAASVNEKDNIEVVITDWCSSDWPLENWIDDLMGSIPYRIIKVKGTFHRGSGRNIAADNAKGSYLFFLDADMIINRNVLLIGMEYLRKNKVYFPICFYYLNAAHTKGFWCEGGRGICMLTRDMYEKAGRWPCPPKYNRNFDEDQRFFQALERTNAEIIVQREKNFFHQYHPGRSVDTIFRRRKGLIIEKQKS